MECLYWFRLPPSLLQTPYTGQTDTVPSVFSYLQLLMLITWHYTHLLRRMPCSNYLLLSGPTAANPPHAIAADEWDGQTDTVPFQRPCCAYYAGSGNNYFFTHSNHTQQITHGMHSNEFLLQIVNQWSSRPARRCGSGFAAIGHCWDRQTDAQRAVT